MTGQHLATLCAAETRKLFGRIGARIGLVVAFGCGLFGPLALWWLSSSSMVINGAQASELFTPDAPTAMRWALDTSNFFIVRAFLILVGAAAFAGEYQARTLREDLLRPVPRWVVLFAKWVALVAWSVAVVAIVAAPAGLVGVLAWGTGGDWSGPLRGYPTTALAHAGFAALVLFAGVMLRSVAATVAGVFLFLVFDRMFGWMLDLVGAIARAAQIPDQVATLLAIKPWLPSSAFNVYAGYHGEPGFEWQSFVSLGVLTALCLTLAQLRFSRMDVP